MKALGRESPHTFLLNPKRVHVTFPENQQTSIKFKFYCQLLQSHGFVRILQEFERHLSEEKKIFFENEFEWVGKHFVVLLSTKTFYFVQDGNFCEVRAIESQRNPSYPGPSSMIQEIYHLGSR